jgi:ComF family protein
MLGNILHSLKALVLDSGCMICGKHCDASMHGICIECRYDIPLTYYWQKEENPVKEHFAGIIPIEHGSSFFFFQEGSQWREAIHQFKYNGRWKIARSLGVWYGAELKESGLYDDIDIVIPVPLHPIKQLKRTYNQSAYIAEGIATSLGVKISHRAVRRSRNNPPQANCNFNQRWENVNSLFRVTNKEQLAGKHILLVDDVLTTGATLSSCAQAILNAVPECRISVATLATTQHITHIR